MIHATSEDGWGRPERIHLNMTRRVSRVSIRETSIPGRGNSECKGPEVETRSARLRNRKEVAWL